MGKKLYFTLFTLFLCALVTSVNSRNVYRDNNLRIQQFAMVQHRTSKPTHMMEVTEMREIEELKGIKEIQETREMKEMQDTQETNRLKEMQEMKVLREIEMKEIKERQQSQEMQPMQQVPQMQQVPKMQQLPQMQQELQLQQVPQMKQMPKMHQTKEMRQVKKAKEIPVLRSKINLTFNETDMNHWRLQAQITLKKKISTPLNTKKAKNIILFVGDGMGISTIAATRVYIGMKYGHLGEELKLSFEVFPFTGLSKTYCVDQNVADSACSATAYLSGVKANSGTVGVSAAVTRGDCEMQKGGQHSVYGLMDWAQRARKSTGIVTTTRVTHATPASSYAHSADRRWEADTDLPSTADCEDIASQLIRGHVGSSIDVILGGGRKNFYSQKMQDRKGYFGYRSDKANLIEEWLVKKRSYGAVPKYITTKNDLLKLDIDRYDSVLGLFSLDHMPFHLDATEEEPSLTDMTTKAIEMLSKNTKGFFLFVEGGKIDIAHHDTKARKALDETAEFAKAIDAALRMVDPENTLIIVTSDHSHAMSYSGYSKRGNDILGFANLMNAADDIPFTTLSYATGPGYKHQAAGKRYNMSNDNLMNVNYTYPSLVPMSRASHAGEDVAVYAKGPWAHLFTGNYEQNYIPHAIAYAACIGPGLTACSTSTGPSITG